MARRGSELWDLKDVYHIFSYLATFLFLANGDLYSPHCCMMEHAGVKTTENPNSNTENRHLWSINYCLKVC